MRKIFAILLLMTALSEVSAREALGLTDTPEYREVCQLAATDDEMFNTFKRISAYRAVLEHVTYQNGIKYLNLIRKNYPDLLINWDKFSTNDSIGTPMIYLYSGLGYASPTTLRYIKIAGEIRDLFGDLTGKKIIEVGGGYGGQCKILSDIFAFEDYLHIEIPESGALAARYLGTLNVSNVHMINPEDIYPEDCDLFISNFGFSECSREMQEAYMKNYILKSSAGYMILNNARDSMTPKPYSLMEIRVRLMKGGFKVKLFAEEPQTHKKNLLITWKKN